MDSFFITNLYARGSIPKNFSHEFVSHLLRDPQEASFCENLRKLVGNGVKLEQELFDYGIWNRPTGVGNK